jgi:hypothetical protein
MSIGVRVLALLLCGVALSGCLKNRKHLDPPVMAEEFRPPPDDARYAGPPTYPNHTLNQMRPPPSSIDEKGLNHPRFSGNPGMR